MRILAFHSAYIIRIVGIVVCIHASIANSAPTFPHQILAFYYGWYGNPATSGKWVHWQNVEPANERIKNSAHFPAWGAYDSHEPPLLDRQAAAARAAGITGFLGSQRGQGGFEDHGIAP